MLSVGVTVLSAGVTVLSAECGIGGERLGGRCRPSGWTA